MKRLGNWFHLSDKKLLMLSDNKMQSGLRDWLLITGRGGAEKVLAMLKGGTASFGVVFTW